MICSPWPTPQIPGNNLVQIEWSGHQNTLDRLCPGVGLAGVANRWGTGLANLTLLFR